MADRTIPIKSGETYTTLNGAIVGEVALYPNLTSNNGSGSAGSLIFECYNDAGSSGQDTTAVTINGFTTSASCKVIVRAASGAEAQMPYSSSRYRLEVSGATALTIADDHVDIEKIQIKVTANSATPRHGVIVSSVGTATTTISRCSILAAYTSNGNGAGVYVSDSSDTMVISNTLINSFLNSTNTCHAVKNISTGGTVTLKNCTFANNYTAVLRDTSGTFTLTNCLFTGNTTDASGTITDTYCATSNDYTKGLSAGGTGNRSSQTFTFVSGTGNFHLAATDAGARDYGTSTSMPTDDFDGDTRSGTWDIGCDEYVAGATGVPKQMDHILKMTWA